jgi:Lrp/AsnC family transcriptional regulator
MGKYSMQLDAIDVKLLGLLQEDATRPISTLSETVNLSTNACWKRIQRLENDGFIKGRVALLDAGRLGVGMTVFIAVQAGEHSEDWLERFATAVRRMPEVVEFYRMAGEVDYLLKVKVADVAAYDAVYKRLIKCAKLGDVSASFAMEEIKHTTVLPLPRVS